jgi:hypothetical protein
MIDVFLDKLIFLFIDNTIFTFSAYAGSGILLIQFLLNLFGSANTLDLNEGDSVGDEKKFKYLSLQTVGGFLMMFGWSAITCQKEFSLSIPSTIFASLFIGLCSVFIINLIFKIAKKFHSPGNTCTLDDVIGKEAFVYQRIAKNGVGKISISFQHLTCEIDAVSHRQEDIASFTRVQILKKKDDTTVVVIPI